jgi:hypothetical protein
MALPCTQAAKMAIRESIEKDMERERKLRDNPDMEVCCLSNLACIVLFSVVAAGWG